MSSLFRQEAIDSKRNQWLGTVTISAQRFDWIATLAASLTLCLAVVLAIFIRYSPHVRAFGTLTAAENGDSLTPVSAELVVESKLNSDIRVGDRVAIRVHSLPYQRFGLQYGSVEKISYEPILTSESVSKLDLKPGETASSVRVSLATTKRGSATEKWLRAGLLVDADIITQPESIFDILFDRRSVQSNPSDEEEK